MQTYSEYLIDNQTFSNIKTTTRWTGSKEDLERDALKNQLLIDIQNDVNAVRTLRIELAYSLQLAGRKPAEIATILANYPLMSDKELVYMRSKGNANSYFNASMRGFYNRYIKPLI